MSLNRQDIENALNGDSRSIIKVVNILLDKLSNFSKEECALWLELANQAIAKNNSNGMCLKAAILFLGLGVKEDKANAINLIHEAIKLNNSWAMVIRASMYVNKEMGPVNYAAAIALYEEAIELKNPQAMYNRATMYKDGLGSPRDYQKAIDLLDKAIALGHGKAMALRGAFHADGVLYPVDAIKAAQLFRLATIHGEDCLELLVDLIYERSNPGNLEMLSYHCYMASLIKEPSNPIPLHLINCYLSLLANDHILSERERLSHVERYTTQNKDYEISLISNNQTSGLSISGIFSHAKEIPNQSTSSQPPSLVNNGL